MDYYIVINGEKQGPFDLLDLIKRVKNGVIKSDTPVATSATGSFVPATEIEELRTLLGAETYSSETHVQQVSNLKFKNIVLDAVELWTRRVIEYTIGVGVILGAGFIITKMLNKIQIIADYSFIANYISTSICLMLLGLFYYYVLTTKRGQEPEVREYKPLLGSCMHHLFLYGAMLSSGVLLYSIGDMVKVIAIVAVFFMASFFAFVPFLIVDHRMTFLRAVSVSVKAFKSMSPVNMGIVFSIVGTNFLAAVVLGIFSPHLILFGLVISLPLTVAALASVYDQVMA